MRRPWLILIALAALMLATAPAAYAQEPTITTDITFPEEGEPFGTFTATEPLCPSGTFVDEFVAGGGGELYGAITVRKILTCNDGSGTFTILFHPQLTPATPPSCLQAGPFAVVGGTGDYATLSGHGDFCVFTDGDRFTETLPAPSDCKSDGIGVTAAKRALVAVTPVPYRVFDLWRSRTWPHRPAAAAAGGAARGVNFGRGGLRRRRR